jgi:hypothetical protein
MYTFAEKRIYTTIGGGIMSDIAFYVGNGLLAVLLVLRSFVIYFGLSKYFKTR